MAKGKNRYSQIIEKIFERNYTEGASEVLFEREDLVRTAQELNIPLPKKGKTGSPFRQKNTITSLLQ
ncbi:MAG: hypothetical protein ACREQA_05795 [Candidatus Binatia bacterium]